MNSCFLDTFFGPNMSQRGHPLHSQGSSRQAILLAEDDVGHLFPECSKERLAFDASSRPDDSPSVALASLKSALSSFEEGGASKEEVSMESLVRLFQHAKLLLIHEGRPLDALPILMQLYTYLTRSSAMSLGHPAGEEPSSLCQVVVLILKCHILLNDSGSCRTFLTNMPDSLVSSWLTEDTASSQFHTWMGVLWFVFSSILGKCPFMERAQRHLKKAIHLDPQGGYAAWCFLVDQFVIGIKEQEGLCQYVASDKGAGSFLKNLYLSKLSSSSSLEAVPDRPAMILNCIQKAYLSLEYAVCIELLRKYVPLR
jgi:hypothetical protein